MSKKTAGRLLEALESERFALLKSAVLAAIRKGYRPRDFASAMALLIRDGINNGDLDVDQFWDVLIAAERGKYNAQWATVFRALRLHVRPTPPKRHKIVRGR